MAALLSPLSGCVLSNSFIVSDCANQIAPELTKSCTKPTDKDDLVDMAALGAKCYDKHEKLSAAVKHCQTQSKNVK